MNVTGFEDVRGVKKEECKPLSEAASSRLHFPIRTQTANLLNSAEELTQACRHFCHVAGASSTESWSRGIRRSARLGPVQRRATRTQVS